MQWQALVMSLLMVQRSGTHACPHGLAQDERAQQPRATHSQPATHPHKRPLAATHPQPHTVCTHLRHVKVWMSYIQSFMWDASLAWGTTARAEATGGGSVEAVISTKGMLGVW